MKTAIDEAGWLAEAARIPSPNFDARPPDASIDLIVIHGISLPPGEYGGGFIEQFFCNGLDPEAHPYFAEIHEMCVSAHCLIARDGQILQFVSFADRACLPCPTAPRGRTPSPGCVRSIGVSEWCGRSCCNDFSVGIELEGSDEDVYTRAQYDSLARLVRELREAYPTIAPDAIAGHSDIAPGRKTDPGPAFDWDRLYQLIKTNPQK